MEGVDNETCGVRGVGGDGKRTVSIWEVSESSFRFGCEPKPARRNKAYFFKKEKGKQNKQKNSNNKTMNKINILTISDV